MPTKKKAIEELRERIHKAREKTARLRKKGDDLFLYWGGLTVGYEIALDIVKDVDCGEKQEKRR